MNGLPPMVLRAPHYLYIASLVFFLASILLNYWDVRTNMAFVPSENAAARLAMTKAVFQAALDAIYLAANGAIIHVLLAIWQDRRAPRDGGGDS